MIHEFQTKAEADAIPQPKEMEHALEFGKWIWRVRTGEHMGPTQAELNQQAREAAKALIDSAEPTDRRFRALLLVMLDEINLIRSKLVPALPPRTPVQLKAAIRAKLDAGQADG